MGLKFINHSLIYFLHSLLAKFHLRMAKVDRYKNMNMKNEIISQFNDYPSNYFEKHNAC